MVDNYKDYGVQPDQPWPRTDGDSIITGDTTHTWGDGSTSTWGSVLGGNISSSERELAKALRDCARDHNNAPMTCYNCENVLTRDQFPGQPSNHNDDCNKCYRNAELPELPLSENPRGYEDLYLTPHTRNRLAHKFSSETIPAIRAQLRIEIAKELSEEKSEANRIINRNILSKTIKRNTND